MNHNKEIGEQYDIISTEFDASRNRIWNTVQLFLTKNSDKESIKTLLDVGVGNGKNVLFANKHNYSCIGIDISDKLLEICETKNVTVFKKDVLELDPSFLGTFDIILCIACIHHLENIELQTKAICNMIKCLKPSGKLLLSVWSKELFNNHDTSPPKQKSDYRNFDLGPNLVEWNSKNKELMINRFYFIHNYKSFYDMICRIQDILPISFTIIWEKQNWFCEIVLTAAE